MKHNIWIVVAALALSGTASAQSLFPEAPSAVVKQQAIAKIYRGSFFADRTNRQLIAIELGVRTLDAISTRQNMSNPCKCFVESGNYFTDGQFFPKPLGRWQGAANSFAGEMAFGLIQTGIHVGESYLLWKLAQHRRPGKVRKILEWGAREPIIFDIQQNLRQGFIHNEMIAGYYK